MKPKIFVDIQEWEVPNLGRKRAQVLCALAEAVIGEDFAQTIGGGPGSEAKGYRELVLDVDDFMNFQSPGVRQNLTTAFGAIEKQFFRHAFLIKAGEGAFTKMSLAERQNLLQKLKDGETENQRQFYTGIVSLVSSFFYGHPSAWPEIGYQGVSVDDQTVLEGHPWRPGDSTPVEPCEPLS